MLTGKLVKLRALEPSDAEALHRWNEDPDVGRWMVNGYPLSRAQVAKRCDDRRRNTYDDLTLCIETLAEGRAIGMVELTGAEPRSAGPS